MEELRNKRLTVVFPADPDVPESPRLEKVLAAALRGRETTVLRTAEEAGAFLAESGRPGPGEGFRPLLFVVSLDRNGMNIEYGRLLRLLRGSGTLLEGYIAGMVVDCESDLYTKAAARDLALSANGAGCAFIGRPLVEGTRTLSNFDVVKEQYGTDREGAYAESASILVNGLMDFRRPALPEKPKILVLHASIRKTSNTLALWHRAAEELQDMDIREISLQNGTLYDCAGCPFRTCLHYGEKNSCFYGGVMVDEVYPAVREADAVVMLCANYNDALSANLTAFINRLTALFRQQRFYDKAMFAVVVSGYSGGDIVAEQLIAALNMNKTFFLPGHFALVETANDAGTAVKLPGIGERVRGFAENIRRNLSGRNDGGGYEA